MSQNNTNTQPHRDGYAYYEPGANRPGRLIVDVNIERDKTKDWILHDASKAFGGDLYDAVVSIDAVATRHLRELTRTNAEIVNDGHAVRITSSIPAPAGNSLNSPDPTARSIAEGRRRSLSNEQSAMLPGLVKTISDVLPTEARHHAQTLAVLVAREIPSNADAVRAYERTTLPEVQNYYNASTGPLLGPPLIHPAATEARMSFPQHASAALNQNTPSPSATPTATATAPHARSTLER
jgi:hypothetical protein